AVEGAPAAQGIEGIGAGGGGGAASGAPAAHGAAAEHGAPAAQGAAPPAEPEVAAGWARGTG
ncbi:hypothetical protein, partial [Sinorhizobium meliloti]|uniref:hypothetical protein n=1 Tax=Rhizobium meliloti TaxID=382 RepID=UPI001AEE1A22